MLCALSCLSGAEFEYQTNWGCAVWEDKLFTLLTPSSTDPSCVWTALGWLHLNSICWPVEWSAVGPRLRVGRGQPSENHPPIDCCYYGYIWLSERHMDRDTRWNVTQDWESTQCREKSFSKACSYIWLQRSCRGGKQRGVKPTAKHNEIRWCKTLKWESDWNVGKLVEG